MSKNLVVVESPAKAKTLSQFLGEGYTVKASLGHVRDLPQKELGVDVDNDFSPKYVVPSGKKKVLREIKQGAAGVSAVYLATDPDREGEAISWHIAQAANLEKLPLKRVVFHEITREAIQEAFRHPRTIDPKLVNAQQARRILDRLVGYQISPLLWKRVRPGLSAGRVQTVALRLIVERALEISNFVPVEYWSLDAELTRKEAKSAAFKAGLVGFLGGSRIELRNEEQSLQLKDELDKARYSVYALREKRSSRQPAPPFITSTLQQEAWRKLKFSAKLTMAVAQQLYEGLSLGEEGSVGLITYMRTDSTRVSPSAISEVRSFVEKTYGPSFLPATPRRFSARVKGAQEAHEAIRPTSVWREPAKIQRYLTTEQFKLYNLIWLRMVSSQMAAAQVDTRTAEIEARSPAGAKYLFRAASSTIAFPGFLSLYQEGRDDGDEENGKAALPELVKGDELRLVRLLPEQHFTQPPPYYSEATLVKALEELGIGRPSTYAPILSLIQDRGYVERRNGKLGPTELGVIVSNLLSEHFPDLFDVGFTARMEQKLDQIASGELEWVPMLHDFYHPFRDTIARASSAIPKISQPTDEICELCKKPMVIKWGRRGKFLSCSGFPECKNARPIKVTLGVACPRCGGELVERRSKKGRLFYGCGKYPECNFASWDKPLPEPCPQCKGLLVLSRGGIVKCTQCEHVDRSGA
ncbi:MAG: type I DNA topoisomerase [Dehalococcoidia bacterium]|nr:type I DNA topoisomerase [Dehalococcoidia bacterium]